MIYHLVILLVLHFVADFLFQTRTMGLNKGKSIMWLSIHVGVYLITFMVFGLIFADYIIDTSDGMLPILEFCILNASLHWITDFITSKFSGLFYLKMLKSKKEGDRKKEYLWQYGFWSIIGLDFTIHIITLIYTYSLYFM